MKLLNYSRGVNEEFGRFPGQLVVANPACKVFQGSTNKLGVNDFINFPLRFVIDNNRGRSRLSLAGERV